MSRGHLWGDMMHYSGLVYRHLLEANTPILEIICDDTFYIDFRKYCGG